MDIYIYRERERERDIDIDIDIDAAGGRLPPFSERERGREMYLFKN